MSSLLVVKHLQQSITLFRGLTRTTAAEFCCPPKIVQNKRWLNFQLEELWSITKSNKYPFSHNQRSVKIEVNKF